MRFGISTHLYHDRRLERSHLAQVAGYGFETIELFATRSHFDYRSEAAVAELGRWLTETELTLNSIHAPIMDVFGGAGPRTTYSNAVTANDRREAAVREAEAALGIARTIPFDLMVLHLGTPAREDRRRQSPRGCRAEPQPDLRAGGAGRRSSGGRSHSESPVRSGVARCHAR
jgi:sugar phosphate isomerase/epimerase